MDMKRLVCLSVALAAATLAFGQDGSSGLQYDPDWIYISGAIESDRLDLLADYLKAGKPHEFEYDRGDVSMLHLALDLRKYEAARLMIEAGVRFDLDSQEGGHARDWAPLIEWGDLDLVRLALAKGYNPNLRMGWSSEGNQSGEVFYPINLAAAQANGDIIKLLLDAGADPNAVWEEWDYWDGYTFSYSTAMDILDGDDEVGVRQIVKQAGGKPVAELPGAGRLYVVTGSGLRVRNAPGTDGDVLGKLDAGVAVRAIQSGPEDTIGGATNIWYYVVAPGGLVGWVFGQFLARK